MNAQLQRREFALTEPPETASVADSGHRPLLEVAAPARVPPKPAGQTRTRRTWRDPAWLWLLATAALLYFGYQFPTEQYITPQTGVGYALGILGASAMLLLLLYPARKRVRALSFIGTTKRWFQAHMVLGIVGPVLVLFHANFGLGASNSNVALACMLIVSGSGLFGRYFYTRIHHGLHGRKANLAELKDYADKLRWVTTSVEFLPDLVARIESEERRVMDRCAGLPLLARPPVCMASIAIARRRLRRHVRNSLRASPSDGHHAARRPGLLQTASGYIDDRLAATRRVVEFAAFERLFSLWHALHLPLFLMLLVAGVVHVVAVHVY
jgi:hypothetical protein